MSSRQLEERYEDEQAAAVAEALGIDVEELELLVWSLSPDESDDGLLYGYIVTFEEGSDPDVLAKIRGAEGGWVQIQISERDPGPDDLDD